jgi:hypothetical protein
MEKLSEGDYNAETYSNVSGHACRLINSDSDVVSGLALWAMIMRGSTTCSSSSRVRVRRGEFLTGFGAAKGNQFEMTEEK